MTDESSSLVAELAPVEMYRKDLCLPQRKLNLGAGHIARIHPPSLKR